MEVSPEPMPHEIAQTNDSPAISNPAETKEAWLGAPPRAREKGGPLRRTF
jgi:hypothetical protein